MGVCVPSVSSRFKLPKGAHGGGAHPHTHTTPVLHAFFLYIGRFYLFVIRWSFFIIVPRVLFLS